MANRRFEMHHYRQVIFRMRMGQSDRAIAKSGLMGRIKCAEVRAVAERNSLLSAVPLPEDQVLGKLFESSTERAAQPSLIEPFESQVKQWWQEGICGTTIHRALNSHGFAGSYSSVRRFLQKLDKRNIQASCVLDFEPGEAAQVDFGTGPTITDVFTGEVLKTWIFVMTLCYSRHQYAELVLDQTVRTWLCSHRHAFEFFNGIPCKVIIDNPKCAITRACYYDPDVQRSYGDLAEAYGFLISPCPPRDPKKKGRVESGVKYIKRSFLPLREFRTLRDANEQLQRWVLEEAGNRIHGTTRQKPLSVFAETEKVFLKLLPDVAPEMAVWTHAKVHGNCHRGQPKDLNQSRAVISKAVSEDLFIIFLLGTLNSLYFPVKVRNILPVLSLSVCFVFLFGLHSGLKGTYLSFVFKNRVAGKLQETVQKLNPIFHLHDKLPFSPIFGKV
ncbi:hypothetical protein TRIP_B240002 [uncultured Desulfatiglans sp.]|nr:hypothetical protein TRIP_B240002 [uncultured Desulfatiglans sp.]